MMKVLMVGPLPPPLNGCAYANEVLCGALGQRHECEQVDTARDLESDPRLAPSHASNARRFLRVYGQLYRVFGARVLYLTPGQTLNGILKFAPFMLLALLLRKPYVIHVHGNYLGEQYRTLHGFERSLFRFLVGHAAAGIVLSESLRGNFARLLPPSRVHVVHNFAGDRLFRADAPAKPTDKLRVLYLSNLVAGKGVLDLLDALLLLQARGVDFEATLAGRLESNISIEVRSRLARLGSRARYLGSVWGDRKLSLLDQANVFVLPTYYHLEGQPISLLEALATGNIVVTTAHAGIPDVIDGANGYIVPVRNGHAIAERLAAIAADLEGELARYSAHNIEYARTRFSERAFIDGVTDVLESAAGPRGPTGEPAIDSGWRGG